MNNHIRYINGTENGHLHFTIESQTWFYYSGIYTCFAENGVIRNAMLYQSGFQHIELKGIPQCLQNSITEHGIQGKSTILSFELYSSPKYTSYQWKTLTYTISNMSRKYDTTVTGTYLKTVLYNDVPFQVAVWRFSLNIYNIDQEDFDIYTIQVINEIGYTSCSVRFKPTNVRDMKNMLYFGILTLSIILLFTSTNNEVSGVTIEMSNIINEYHTINEEDIRQEFNEVQNQAEMHNTYDSSSHDSDDKSDESATNENELRESNDYLNPYCTMIQSTSDVHNYESLSSEKMELNTSIANVDLNTGIQRSYENLKF
ncbi:unnamed protein product [Mytilus edulis]|uniref:Ig-like domain-containing protein n=1 Tax=Mytilus edulis TaxID=6550 RepID=A0A8S3QX58_MYTED|nr:unnamed protein product [Mytilus edulis]